MTPFHINFPDEHGILCSEIHCEAWHETMYSLAFVVVLYEFCPLVQVLLNRANLSCYSNACFLVKCLPPQNRLVNCYVLMKTSFGASFFGGLLA